ncbi:hypothetical protein NPX13_g10341 [Xylaria arbuscula]|uniref:Uncharacterized protein n=1 Tax=Xylaria arbuscula TaxID=114810 RepID=A0A9W8TGP0_9PEZI|nr:hypothetical protein NPX13_g10341 [Xylaria arbuscula]
MDPSNPNSSDPVGDTMSVAKSHVEPGNHANVNAQSTEQRGVKRPADDDLLNDDASDNNAPHETMGGRKRREAAETYRQTARQASSERAPRKKKR